MLKISVLNCKSQRSYIGSYLKCNLKVLKKLVSLTADGRVLKSLRDR